MEQKRVLWIVAAVGLFLLVVIGTALWISSPSALQNTGISWNRSGSQLQTLNNSPYVASSNNTASVSGQNEIKQIDFSSDGNGQAPVNLNTLETTAPNASATAEPAASASQSAANTPASTDARTASAGLAQTAVTLNVNITPSSGDAPSYTENAQQPATKGTSSRQKPATSTATASAPANTTSQAPAAAAPKTTAETTSSAPKTTTTTTAEKTASSSSNTVKTVPVIQPDQFWVQVASFTGKKNAEDARTALAEQKINGEVFTYQDSKGTIYYRLRVGPYKTKSEAEYWHKIIKEIEQFDGTDSYVVNSTVK